MKFENPHPKPALIDCAIYHSIDLPNERLTGDWDLKPVISDYTSQTDFRGKTVLDVGTATGFLSFHAESAGASSVVSFDASPGCYEPIPWSENNPDSVIVSTDAYLERLKRGYWYCWHSLSSRAHVQYGDLHDASPETLGVFDIVISGCILLHLPDPFCALIQIAALCRKELIVTNIDPDFTDNPILLPNYVKTGKRDPDDTFSWWSLPVKTMSRLLDVIGFNTDRVTRFTIPSLAHGCELTRFYSLKASRR